MGIKSFIYLDEYKMYSISSQIFAGLTEYVIDYSSRQNSESEQQKGEFGSGRILADIISKEASVEEKKFLHDYSYTLFEDKLLTEKKVSVINRSNLDDNVTKIDVASFIKVTGPLIFNDLEIINNTITNFNELGEALVYVTNYKNFAPKVAQIDEALRQITDRNKRTPLIKQREKELNIVKLAQEQNLHQDEELLKKLAYLLNYGFRDQLEVQIRLPSKTDEEALFSANLNRQYLKENQSLLIRKYARYTEKEFVIFGMVTQSKDTLKEHNEDDETDFKSVKEALLKLVSKLYNVEVAFIGRLGNEIVIDPIAIYREL